VLSSKVLKPIHDGCRRYGIYAQAAILYGCIQCAIITKCLDSINNNSTIMGILDNHGKPPLPGLNATVTAYSLLASQCGTGQKSFQWTVFSEQFSSLLLPWPASLSQLPFGANDKLNNLESMLLTLGRPSPSLPTVTMFSFGERLGMFFPVEGGWCVGSIRLDVITTHAFTASHRWLSPLYYSLQW